MSVDSTRGDRLRHNPPTKHVYDYRVDDLWQSAVPPFGKSHPSRSSGIGLVPDEASAHYIFDQLRGFSDGRCARGAEDVIFILEAKAVPVPVRRRLTAYVGGLAVFSKSSK